MSEVASTRSVPSLDVLSRVSKPKGRAENRIKYSGLGDFENVMVWTPGIHIFSNPFLGQERFGGVLECTAEEIDWTLNMQEKKISKFSKCAFIWPKKKKKLSRKNLKISKPSTVVRKICMPQKEAGSMVYNSYLTWWAAGFGAKHFLIR